MLSFVTDFPSPSSRFLLVVAFIIFHCFSLMSNSPFKKYTMFLFIHLPVDRPLNSFQFLAIKNPSNKFLECLLFARNYRRPWGYSREWDSHGSFCPYGKHLSWDLKNMKKLAVQREGWGEARQKVWWMQKSQGMKVIFIDLTGIWKPTYAGQYSRHWGYRRKINNSLPSIELTLEM